MITAYLNGDYLPLTDAKISVMDRGFLFGDAVYEVIPVYEGRLFRLDEHLARLANSLTGIRLSQVFNDSLYRDICQELVTRNGGGNQSVYLQITRGVAETRDPLFPAQITPTVFGFSKPYTIAPVVPIKAITLPDIRWQLCYLKATTLLANILQRQQAKDQDAQEAILIHAGHAIECTSSNLFMVKAGTLVTPPANPRMLGGITRELLLELARQQQLPVLEKAIPESELAKADEIWICSSLREIQPVIELNDEPVGNGQPGPIWQLMYGYYQDYKRRFVQGEIE